MNDVVKFVCQLHKVCKQIDDRHGREGLQARNAAAQSSRPVHPPNDSSESDVSGVEVQSSGLREHASLSSIKSGVDSRRTATGRTFLHRERHNLLEVILDGVTASEVDAVIERNIAAVTERTAATLREMEVAATTRSDAASKAGRAKQALTNRPAARSYKLPSRPGAKNKSAKRANNKKGNEKRKNNRNRPQSESDTSDKPNELSDEPNSPMNRTHSPMNRSNYPMNRTYYPINRTNSPMN